MVQTLTRGDNFVAARERQIICNDLAVRTRETNGATEKNFPIAGICGKTVVSLEEV